MDAQYYCSTMNSELTGLKARIYSIARELDRQQGTERSDQMQDDLSDLYCMVDDLTSRINELNRECPPDFGARKQEIDEMKRQVTEKIDMWDAEHIAGGYVGG